MVQASQHRMPNNTLGACFHAARIGFPWVGDALLDPA
jgi:hypothetical protein